MNHDLNYENERRRRLRSAQEDAPIASLTAVHIEMKQNHVSYELAKRAIDVLGALAGLIVLSPILMIVAFIIKFTDGGSIVFNQKRLGRGGKEFQMYKFRSMVVNAEKLQAALMDKNEVNGPVFKIKKDPRITTVGRFIRKYSIDELPQLINVLKGEMSIVGPRPGLAREAEKFLVWQTKRLTVKPGLTCLWQIGGRNHLTFEEWMRLDSRYVDERNLMLDIKIILRTIRTVLFPDGAY